MWRPGRQIGCTAARSSQYVSSAWLYMVHEGGSSTYCFLSICIIVATSEGAVRVQLQFVYLAFPATDNWFNRSYSVGRVGWKGGKLDGICHMPCRPEYLRSKDGLMEEKSVWHEIGWIGRRRRGDDDMRTRWGPCVYRQSLQIRAHSRTLPCRCPKVCVYRIL